MRPAQAGWLRSALLGAALLLCAIAGGMGRATDEEPAPAAPEAPVDANTAKLEAIGGLSAINAQQAFLLVGVVSDAHIKGIYDARQVRSLMNGVIRQLDSVSDMLRKLQKTELSAADNEYVEQVLAVHVKLQAQARALLVFVDKKGETEARGYEKARQSTLKVLESLLGVEEKPAAEDKDDDNDEGEKRP